MVPIRRPIQANIWRSYQHSSPKQQKKFIFCYRSADMGAHKRLLSQNETRRETSGRARERKKKNPFFFLPLAVMLLLFFVRLFTE